MFLGLDLGTTNVKTVLVDRGGQIVGRGSAPVDRFHTAGGGVEQDIEQIWDATCRAIQQAARQRVHSVQAIGVSSQGGALQLLDAADRPVGRVISWLDGRGRPYDDELLRELGADYFIGHLGCNFSAMTLGQWIRLGRRQPGLLAGVRRVGFVGDVVVGRLCGRRAHDATSLSIAMLYNPSLGRADPDLLDRLGIQENQLPELLSATTPAGTLLARAAEKIGLPAGIPVSPAVHDQYAASVGAGSVRVADVCLGTGTAWVLLGNTPRLAPPVTERNFVCPHPVDGLFGQLLSMVNGGSAIEWAARLTGREPLTSAEIDDILAAVPAGSNGLRCWPLLAPGTKGVSWQLPGGRLQGLALAHSADHLIRAVVEGLACELARHLEFFTRAAMPIRRLILSGGAAASRVTPRILAGVTGRPVTCASESAVSAFGAAVIGRAMVDPGVALGKLAEQVAPAIRSVEPGPNVEVYRRLLEEYLEAFTPHGTEK